MIIIRNSIVHLLSYQFLPTKFFWSEVRQSLQVEHAEEVRVRSVFGPCSVRQCAGPPRLAHLLWFPWLDFHVFYLKTYTAQQPTLSSPCRHPRCRALEHEQLVPEAQLKCVWGEKGGAGSPRCGPRRWDQAWCRQEPCRETAFALKLLGVKAEPTRGPHCFLGMRTALPAPWIVDLKILKLTL